MATMPPMNDTADMTGMAEPEAAGYEICIAVDAQGQISVGVEAGKEPAMAEPGMEQGEGMEAESAMQPAGDIKTALTMALEIYKANGTMQDSGESAAAFKAGFDGGDV